MNQPPNNMSGKKIRKLETLAKLLQAISRTICWQNCRTTYFNWNNTQT